jgi:alkylation response protein AidB-like acyl-CoA dehydrogenase
MNFDFTDDQQAIKRTAHELLADRFRPERVRELAESGEYDRGAWAELVELGWPGIYVAESHGGQGLGLVELVILVEELGYALAPSPFLSNAAAGLLVQHGGSDEQRERLLPGIAAGDPLATIGERRGEVAIAPDADAAESVVVIEGGVGPGPAANVQRAEGAERVDSIDSTRALYRVQVGGGEPLDDAAPGLDRARVALAAELVGVTQRAMEMAVAHAREREQFGRPIGAYQAVSHRCAQMLLEVEGARSATYYAAWAGDHEPETLPLAASMAKAYASDAGTRVSSSALQVLGGIGFTWEHDLHFLLKRARADAHFLGGAREHRDRVAELAGLGATRSLDPTAA